MSERVYAIGPAGSGVVKIGRALDPQGRLPQIQVGHPVRIEVRWTVEGGAFLERQLHEEFSEYWTFGEWFDFGAVDPIPLISAAAERFRPSRRAGTPTRDEIIVKLRKAKGVRTARNGLPRQLIMDAIDAELRVSEIAREVGCSTTAVKNIRNEVAATDPRYAHLKPPTKESAT